MLALSAAGYGAIALPSAALITAIVGFLVFTRDARARRMATDTGKIEATVKGQAGFIAALQIQIDRYIKQSQAAEDRAQSCEVEVADMRTRLNAALGELAGVKIEQTRLRTQLARLTRDKERGR